MPHEPSGPTLLKTALTPPAIPLLLGAEKAKGEDAEAVGGRIAPLRREKGMTQIELAERLRVSQPVISDYENDVIRLPANTVVQIAEILGASTDELLGLKAPAAQAAGGIKNRRLYRRMQEIEKLSRRDQEALLRTIEAFISKAS